MSLLDQPWFFKGEYPFALHVFKQAAGNMHYLDEGLGEPIVFVHGTPSWSFDYRHLVAALSKRYRCIVPDHLGFGLSDKPQNFTYSVDAHTQNLKNLLAHLKIERCRFVLHDFGGPVAMPLVLANHATQLVLMNTWMWPFDQVEPDFAKQKRLAGSALMRWFYARLNFSARVMVKMSWGKRMPLTRALHRHYLAPFPNKQSRLGTLGFLNAMVDGQELQNLWSQRDKLSPCPTLLVWGMADPMVKPAHLQMWEQLLPHAQTLRLTDVGHFPQEEAADEVAMAVSTFFDAGCAVAEA